GAAQELVVASARRQEPSPCHARLSPAAEVLIAAEGVQHVELVRRTTKPALLELARHRDQPLGDGRDVVPCGSAPPRVCAGPAVGEDAAREDEAFLALWPQLRERLEAVLQQAVRELELGFDVRLLADGADQRCIAARAQEQADRLREDRLARAGLAGERVEPGREVELGLADQDQVLDAQTAQHAPDGTHAVGVRLAALQDANAFRYRVKNVRSGSVASMPVCDPRPTSTRSPGSSMPASCPSTITVTEPSGVSFVTRRSRMWGTTSGRT